MTDSAPRDLDQLASDLADGLLPPDEASRLRADPEIAARLARIEALRSALRTTPPPPPAGALDRMVAAAVDAAAAGSGTGPRHLHSVAPGPSAPPAPRHSAPPTPRGRSARPWLAAAAAVAVGLAMAGVLAQGGSSDSDMSTAGDAAHEPSEVGPSAADDSRSQEGGAATSDSDLGAGSPDSDTTDGAPDDEATVDNPLSTFAGSADSPEELADLVRAERVTSPELPPVETGQADTESCPGLRREGDSSRGVVSYSAEAEYQGAPVVVHVYDGDSGMRLVATDQSCADVVDVPFEE